MWKTIKGWFVSEVRVMRQNQVPPNRKQRRAMDSIARKRRRKNEP